MPDNDATAMPFNGMVEWFGWRSRNCATCERAAPHYCAAPRCPIEAALKWAYSPLGNHRVPAEIASRMGAPKPKEWGWLCPEYSRGTPPQSQGKGSSFAGY